MKKLIQPDPQKMQQQLKTIQQQKNLAVVDLEATCTDDLSLKSSFINEIIEFGLVIVNLQTQEVIKHQIYTKPEKSIITPFCTQLTGISDKTLENAVSFSEALVQIRDIFSQYSELSVWTSFGDYDRNQINRQCLRSNLFNPFSKLEHINVKNLAWHISNKPKPLGLGQMLQHFGMQFQGNQHCGVDDAFNISRLIQKLAF